MEFEAYCEYPFNRVRITAEGWVAFCCFQRPDPSSATSPYLGNLLDTAFDQIWFGEVAEEVRGTTAGGGLHPKCTVPGCPYACTKPPYPKKRFTYNEYPTFLEIDLPNTHCNVGLEDPGPDHPACIMCERAAPPSVFKKEKDRLMEVLPRIVHLMPNLQQIHVQGIAEPFYKDLMFRVLDVLKFDDHKDRIVISTSTNGTLFNAACRREYLARVPRSITNFSIDAATAETFQKIRILPLFDHVIQNLNAFSRERAKDRQFLRIHNNINVLNVAEVVGMVKIAHEAGVDVLEFNPTDGFNTSILVNATNCGLFKKAQMDIVEECDRLGVRVNFLRPLDMGLTDQLIQITL